MENLSPRARQIWELVFDPRIDTGIPVVKRLQKERVIFEALEPDVKAEIGSVLLTDGSAGGGDANLGTIR
jgi:hypothetical protein